MSSVGQIVHFGLAQVEMLETQNTIQIQSSRHEVQTR